MLNIEYYKDKLVELGVIDINTLALVPGRLCHCCDVIQCCNCLFNNNFSCSDRTLNQLFTEYKEPEVDWSKVKVDTPILVRDDEDEEWMNRYFAKFADGKVYTWGGGTTSWTADGEYRANSWKYAKLAEREETVWQRSELQKNQIQEICNILN